jgi:hypothetical protein
MSRSESDFLFIPQRFLASHWAGLILSGIALTGSRKRGKKYYFRVETGFFGEIG